MRPTKRTIASAGDMAATTNGDGGGDGGRGGGGGSRTTTKSGAMGAFLMTLEWLHVA
jgi:hypothetical protein